MLCNLLRTVGTLLFINLAMTGNLLAAQPAPSDTHWVCWYNNDTTVRCVMLQPSADSDAAERAVKIARPVAGASPLPANVRRIIRAGEELQQAELVIPLFTAPEGDLLVEQLAGFTTCFGKSDCVTTFWRPRTVVAMLD